MASKGQKIGFGYHLTAYVAVNAILIWLNLDNYPGYPWVQWPLIGWGIGLALHALGVFVLPNSNNKGFFYHLAVFIMVNALLVYINLFTYPLNPYFWFKFPLTAWGCMLAFHGWRVFWNFRQTKSGTLEWDSK